MPAQPEACGLSRPPSPPTLGTWPGGTHASHSDTRKVGNPGGSPQLGAASCLSPGLGALCKGQVFRILSKLRWVSSPV